MARATRHPSFRPRASPEPSPAPRGGAPAGGPQRPARRPRSRHPRRSRSRAQPLVLPARPRSPTPRAGRRSLRSGPRRPRPSPAQCTVSLGEVAGSGGPARSLGPLPGSRAGGRKGEPLEDGMELGERKRLLSASSDGDWREENKLKRGISQDLCSSPKLDRYKIARQLTEKAIKEKKIFSIYGHYPVIRAALRRKGWVEKKLHFLPKVIASGEGEGEGATESKQAEGKENQEVPLEETDDIHDLMSRLVRNEMPYFLWTIKRDSIDYHSLGCDQMLNHYGKTASFTTKIGLCLNLRSLPWYVQADPDAFFPRCYGLCSDSEKQEFLDDFRRTVACSVLKWVVSHRGAAQSRKTGEAKDSDPDTQNGSLLAGCRHVQGLTLPSSPAGVHLPSGSCPTPCGPCCLSSRSPPPTWGQRLWWQPGHLDEGTPCAQCFLRPCSDLDLGFQDSPEKDAKLEGLSEQLVDLACRVCQARLGQLEHEDIDEPEDAARDPTEDEWKELTQQYYSLIRGDAFVLNSGSHLSQCQALLNRISSVSPQTEIDGLRNIWIVKPAAKSRGRDIVCMDRVEEILELVAADHSSTKDKWVVQKYIETPLLIHGTKFDIRQWFLVTDWNPLTIWFYKESYLRFSTRRFSLDDLDGAIHLCNNSIQKHLRNDKDRSPLLPPHNMWTSTRFQEYLQRRGQGSVWSSVVYPCMKRAIANTMKVAQDHVEPRKNSFELYGADFILGHDFKPWLIEINSSPAMHPSTPVTAQLCTQVQEDTIKVVVDRKGDRSCDVGKFELLWRQPAVDLPPAHGSDLCVEGVSVRKAKKQTPPTPGLKFSSPLLDPQLLKVRCPSSVSAVLAPGPPQTALQQDLKLKDGKVLA
ncbi:protein monoglycylase TTLL8 [Molossus nigricans]